jgi:hypothetical protein
MKSRWAKLMRHLPLLFVGFVRYAIVVLGFVAADVRYIRDVRHFEAGLRTEPGFLVGMATTWAMPVRLVMDFMDPVLGPWTHSTISGSVDHTMHGVQRMVNFEGRSRPTNCVEELENETLDLVGPDVMWNRIHRAIIFPDIDRENTKSHVVFTPEFIYYPKEFQDWSQMIAVPANLTSNERDMRKLDRAIYFYHAGHFCYFHVIVESFPLLYSVDRSIIESSVLLVGKTGIWSVVDQALGLLDLQPMEVFHLEFRAVFAWTLYLLSPYNHRKTYPKALWAMIQFISEKILGGIVPSRRIFLQRGDPDNDEAVQRRIINIDEVMNRLHVHFDDPKFELVKADFALVDQVKLFRETKCLVGVRGSGLSNVIWMLPDTALVEIQTRHCDLNFARLAKMCGLWVFETGHPNVHSFAPFMADVEVIATSVKAAYDTLKWKCV